MDILLSALEISPYVTQTSSAESVGSLAKALRLLGNEVTVVVPRRPEYEEAGLLAARRLTPLDLGEGEEAVVFDAQLPSGVRLILLEGKGIEVSNELLSGPVDQSRPVSSSDASALSLFARSVAALAEEAVHAGQPFEVVHAFDFGAGLGLLEIKRRTNLASGLVLSVHDASRMGFVAEADAAALGISPQLANHYGFSSDGGMCILKGLLNVAQRVIVPSEAYSKQVCTPGRWGVLASAFEQAKPIGILEGVDHALYNPATDPALSARFDGGDPSPKGINKTRVLNDLELDPELTRPFFLVEDYRGGDSAIDTVLSTLPGLMRLDATVVVAAQQSASPEQREVLDELATRVKWVQGVAPRERRRLLAAADFYLCVQRRNSSAQSLLQAQRYAAIPVAYAVDSAGDAVVDCDAQLSTGTGFLFDTLTQRAVEGACARAVTAFRREGMERLIKRVIRQDLDWDRPARRHLQVYRQVVAAGG